MKNKTWLWIIGVIAVLMGVYFITTLGFNKEKKETNATEFSAYVSGYTSGVVSKSSSIKVQLTNEFAKTLGEIENRETNLFEITPKIKGTIAWFDYRTILFTPDEPLESDKNYRVNFKMGILDNQLDRKYRNFDFNFKTKPQNFNINVTEIKTTDKKTFRRQQIWGEIKTSDTENIENIEKAISVEVEGNNPPIKVIQTSPNLFSFVIDSVERKDTEQKIRIEYNGENIGVNKTGSKSVKIPSLNEFSLLDITLIQKEKQCIQLQFSDPILENQYLDGLIELEDAGDVDYTIKNNIIKIFPETRLDGNYKISVNQGIKNILGHRLKKEHKEILLFEQISPAVQISGSGIIMPRSEGNLILPFKAVNLRAVDVRITKIFETNVMQFLQVNDLSEDYELKRVGKVIKQKTVFLDQTDVTDLSKWNHFTLDLNELISADPGAIYRVDIGFRKKYAIYPCNQDDNNGDDLQNTTSTHEDERFWRDFDDYYYEYDWEKEDDPCHPAYYGFRRAVSRNVFASNLGMTVKQGNDGSILVAVTNLISATPVNSAKVELYNYQQQLIASKSTDKDGVAIFEPNKDEVINFVIAAHEQNRAYIKINDGNTLSISDFDVSGIDVSDGLKGFIYAERGVWRPGDSIFVNFILEDLRNEIPIGHPVIFELYNYQSQLIDKQIQNLNQWKFHSFKTKTNADAPTGYYRAKLTVGGKTFYKGLPIETIKPNRLKIDLQLQNNELYSEVPNAMNLWINWLHGAPAKNINAKVSMSLYSTHTSFEDFKGYKFDDESKSFEFNTETILDANTNDEGHIMEDIELDVENAPGKLIAQLTTKAFEKGGNFSIQEKQVIYHPYDSYVGMKITDKNEDYENYISTNEKHNINIVLVTPQGELLKSNHRLNVELIKVDWSWWYYASDYESNYTSSDTYEIIKEETLSTQKGKADWSFKISNDKWGYYILRVSDLESGHSTSQRLYADWPEYAGIGRNQSKSANILQFKADKDKYTVNESVKLTLPGVENGRAFICIENGSRVLEHHWIKTKKGETDFLFNLSEEMTPNVFVHISMIQPHDQTINDRPIRMYGVIPISVENPKTHLEPELIVDDELQAESEVTITVKEKNHQDMTYTLALVDEGLLTLTNYKTPNPWDYFYAREALGVKTWDMYDWVIGAYGQKLERLLSIGGGDALNKEAGKNNNRFKPVVKFLGPIHIKNGKKTTHTIQLPKYVGAVRVMLVAANDKGAYGSIEKTCKVTKPLMVLGTLPRVLGTQEEVTLPVTVFAMKDKVKDVSVQIKHNDMFEPSSSKNQQSIHFNKLGDQTIIFPLKTINKTGQGKVEIIATSGNEKASYTIDIEVRNPNPPMVKTEGFNVKGEESYTLNFNEFGIPGTGSTKLEVYTIPPINLNKRLKYLISYPHGCIEQIVSAAFPQLYLDKFTKLTDEQKQATQDNINATLKKLHKYQLTNGGFSYWAGGSNVNLWGTNYAGHFMIEAQKHGYDVPQAVLLNWYKYQKEKAMKWTNDGERSQLIQAYRLYDLALYGKPVNSAMNRLRQSEKLNDDAAWRLAATYEICGKHKIAEELIKNLDVKINPYNELSNTFGSSTRDEAMILETFVLMNQQEDAFEVLMSMSKTLGSDQWLSTQTTAYALLATGMYLDKYGVNKELNFSYQLNNDKKNSIQDTNPVLSIPLTAINETNSIQVNNNSDAMIYVRLVSEGVPKPGNETASNNKITMSVKYYDTNGQSINPAVIEQGTDFICEVQVKHNSFEYKFEEMALTQIFPSGWELINSRMFHAQLGETSGFTYQDIRDDRIYTYFNLYKNKTKTYRIMLNASYTGKFYLPAFNVEAMYDKSIHARNLGTWVEVVPPQN